MTFSSRLGEAMSISSRVRRARSTAGRLAVWTGFVSVLGTRLERCSRGNQGSEGVLQNRKGTHEMSTTHRKRWAAIGAAFGAGVAAVVVSALAAFAGSGAAASQAKPVNTQPPTISGTPQEGQTPPGDRGQWNNNPTDYNWFWLRCNKNGGGCAQVGSAAGQKDYLLGSADVGNTIRLRIRAKNNDGQTDATSVPTAVIAKAAPTTPPRGN